MKISIRGWSRDHGSRVLWSQKLTDVEAKEDVTTHHANKPVIVIESLEDGVPQHATLHAKITATINGDYLLSVRFYPTDVLYLMWIMLKSRSIDYMIKTISKFEKATVRN